MKSYKAILSEHLTRVSGEKRYVVIDVFSREVLDSNNDEGYLTESKAISSFELKEYGYTSKQKDKERSRKRNADRDRKYHQH